MKKIYTLSIICLAALNAFSQKPGKKEAKQLLQNTITCLKTNDTSAFVKMWLLNNDTWPYHKGKFTKQDVKDHFVELQHFLDTALVQNYKFDEIEIEQQCDSDNDPQSKTPGRCDYNVQVVFKYSDHYFKGIGFDVVYADNKWLYRFEPDYTTITRPN